MDNQRIVAQSSRRSRSARQALPAESQVLTMGVYSVVGTSSLSADPIVRAILVTCSATQSAAQSRTAERH